MTKVEIELETGRVIVTRGGAPARRRAAEQRSITIDETILDFVAAHGHMALKRLISSEMQRRHREKQ